MKWPVTRTGRKCRPIARHNKHARVRVPDSGPIGSFDECGDYSEN